MIWILGWVYFMGATWLGFSLTESIGSVRGSLGAMGMSDDSLTCLVTIAIINWPFFAMLRLAVAFGLISRASRATRGEAIDASRKDLDEKDLTAVCLGSGCVNQIPASANQLIGDKPLDRDWVLVGRYPYCSACKEKMVQ